MKKLTYGFHFVKGRSNGRISSFHRGGGNKKLVRLVDRFSSLYDVPAKVVRLEYDPCRSSKLALLAYTNGCLSYVPAVQNLMVGDYVCNSDSAHLLEQGNGFTLKLRFVKIGSKLSSVEFYPLSGASLSRAAGNYSVLVRKYSDGALLRLPSGEFRLFSLDCFCTVGSVSQVSVKSKLSKAGENRWHGIRPIVRGRAMNPVDHPHGGRTNGGMVPSTPWGQIAKGVKTSNSRSSLRLKSI